MSQSGLIMLLYNYHIELFGFVKRESAPEVRFRNSLEISPFQPALNASRPAAAWTVLEFANEAINLGLPMVWGVVYCSGTFQYGHSLAVRVRWLGR